MLNNKADIVESYILKELSKQQEGFGRNELCAFSNKLRFKYALYA